MLSKERRDTMKRFRKKGDIILFALGYILLICALAAILINFLYVWETFGRVKNATEEAARIRSQAIDISLKEQTGKVEVLHDVYPYGVTDTIDHDHITTAAGHRLIRNPNDSQYQAAVDVANDAAIQGAKDYLKSALTQTNYKKDFLKTVEFCVDTKPLPDTVTNGMSVTFSCKMPSGNVITETVPVSTVADNTYVVYEDPTTGDKITQSVHNVVFVASRFEYRYFISSVLESLHVTSTKTSEVYAIAYPQVDDCYGSFCD